MGEKKTNPVTTLTIDGVDYDVNDFTDQQKILLDHVVDLDRKLNSAKFAVDQLQVGRDAFFNLLKTALTPKE
jgi:hypothetical protein